MAEYIEREAALVICEKEYQERVRMSDLCGDTVAWNIGHEIKAIPAADVREVVRGKWISDCKGKYSASGDNFYCSICKDPSLRAFGKPAKTNYCPNCGADMRIFSTNCENTVTTGENREIFNLRAWLKNGKG